MVEGKGGDESAEGGSVHDEKQRTKNGALTMTSDRQSDKRETNTTATVLRPFFHDQPGETVPKESFHWTLWC